MSVIKKKIEQPMRLLVRKKNVFFKLKSSQQGQLEI